MKMSYEDFLFSLFKFFKEEESEHRKYKLHFEKIRDALLPLIHHLKENDPEFNSRKVEIRNVFGPMIKEK